MSKISKLFPMKVRTCLKEILHWICMIISYPFQTPHNRAYARWVIFGGENKRYQYDLTENSIVFDVGGYHGDFTDKIVNKYGCKSYIFEPVKEYADAIEKRFLATDKVRVFSFGLSDHTSKEAMLIDDDGSSVHGTITSDAPTEMIALKNIIEFMSDEKITKVDLIKLNIEGGEYEVLRALLDSDTIENFRYIQVQFHDIDTHSDDEMKAIVDQLTKTHKLMWKCRPFIWESWELKNR